MSTANVASFLDGLVRASTVPGIQYVAVRAHGIVCDYAGGWADLSRRVPMESGTTQMAYSMSKTVTAAAALQLVQTRRIGLDEAVDRYVPDLPYGSRVTVRDLIAHTSGIPNPIPLRWVHPASRHAEFDEAAALADVMRRNRRLRFEPGLRYAYSNIGYWLLGRVIETASGEFFTAYVTGHVLRRLGIEPGALGYTVPDPSRHATGYLEKYSLMNLVKAFLIDRELVGDYSGAWLEIRAHYLNGPAFGGLVGTARGFAAFLQDQLREQSALFDNVTRDRFFEPQQTTGGRAVPTTLGWHIGDLRGTRVFYKEGGGGGFHCLMRLYPESGMGTVMMTNATGFDVRRALDRLDSLLLTH